jgi:hypothetical protein
MKSSKFKIQFLLEPVLGGSGVGARPNFKAEFAGAPKTVQPMLAINLIAPVETLLEKVVSVMCQFSIIETWTVGFVVRVRRGSSRTIAFAALDLCYISYHACN